MVVARRYARALHDEAVEISSIDAVDRDVELIRTTFDQSDELARMFTSPIVPREKKQAVVRGLFEERLDPVTLQFLEMLIRKQREDLFPQIVRAYREMRDEELGIVEVRARTAWTLNESETTELAEALRLLTGKKVRLHVEQDPDLIGGIIIRVGDTVYDGSVRHQLELLRGQMEVRSFSLN